MFRKVRARGYVLECDACDCGQDGLGCEVASAEIGGREGQDLEG